MKERLKELVNGENRVFGLDLLRFFAIMLVVFGHSRWMTESFPRPLKVLFHGSGILGVELFFVLSGFLIGGILLKSFEKQGFKLSSSEIKQFWIRRWFRTLPNYFLILGVYLLVYWEGRPDNLWRYLIFVQNFFNYPPYFFEESWSLAIEELSYLLSPLVLAFASVVFYRSGVGKGKLFLWVSIGLIVFITFLRFTYSNLVLPSLKDLPNYSWQYMLREVATIRLDSIYYGFVAVYLSRKYESVWSNFKWLFFIVGFLGILLLMKFSSFLMDHNPSNLINTLYFTVLSVSIAFLLPLLSSLKQSKWRIVSIPVTWISIISYSMYLINGGLLSWKFSEWFSAGKSWESPFEAGVYYVAYWFCCIFFSTLLYLFFEKPFTGLREKLSK